MLFYRLMYPRVFAESLAQHPGRRRVPGERGEVKGGTTSANNNIYPLTSEKITKIQCEIPLACFRFPEDPEQQSKENIKDWEK